jgi:hypothetical protein
LAQWLYDSVPFDGTNYPFSSPTLSTAAGRDDTEANRRAVASIDVQNDQASRQDQSNTIDLSNATKLENR